MRHFYQYITAKGGSFYYPLVEGAPGYSSDWIGSPQATDCTGSPWYAGPILFLCSPLANYVTSHVLQVDGGH